MAIKSTITITAAVNTPVLLSQANLGFTGDVYLWDFPGKNPQGFRMFDDFTFDRENGYEVYLDLEKTAADRTLKFDISGYDVGRNVLTNDIAVVYKALGTSHSYTTQMKGVAGIDLFVGSGKAESFDGLGGNDRLFGNGGKDRLEGGTGNDYLDGGSSDDRLYGEDGNDTIKGGSGNDYISAGNHNDSVDAGSGNDTIYGGAGNDNLYGSSGDDVIKGDSGKDTIRGGTGADDLYGGSDADVFLFKAITESTVATAGRDTIFDFVLSGGDVVNLASIDANTKVSGNQAFVFIDKQGFHGKAGELRMDVKASDTYVYGDVNGDKKADFAIHFDDALALTKYDFIL